MEVRVLPPEYLLVMQVCQLALIRLVRSVRLTCSQLILAWRNGERSSLINCVYVGSSPTASIFMDKCTSGLCGFPAKEVIGNFPWVQIPPYPSLLCYGRNGRGNWFWSNEFVGSTPTSTVNISYYEEISYHKSLWRSRLRKINLCSLYFFTIKNA